VNVLSYGDGDFVEEHGNPLAGSLAIFGSAAPEFVAAIEVADGEVNAEMWKAECAVVKSNGLEGESPSGLAESRRSLERKN
jgi:hypothetical protein